MATKSAAGVDSPSSSNSHTRRSRKESGGSVSLVSQVDKETLSQALDQIHYTASKTESLTTFNEFATPPNVSTGANGKGLSNDLQGGLSGLYSRFRASVGGLKDVVGVSVSGGMEESTTKSAVTTVSTAASHGRHSSGGAKDSVSKVSHNNHVTVDPIKLKPESKSISDTVPTGTSRVNGHNTDAKSTYWSATSGTTSKVSLVPDMILKPIPATLAHATPSGAAGLTLAEATVVGEYSRELSEDSRKDAGFQSASTQPNAEKRIVETMTRSAHKPREETILHLQGESPGGWDGSQFDLSTENPRRSSVDGQSPREHSHNLSKVEKDINVNYDGLSADNSLDAKINSQSTGSPASSINPSRSIPNIKIQPSGISVAPTTRIDGHSENSPSDSRSATPSPHGLGTLAAVRESSTVPSFQISRASSTDTVGASSINTAVNLTSTREDPSADEGANSLGQLRSKPSAPTQRPGTMREMKVAASQIKNRVLSKEYWMRDENARDCFYCGDPFSTFRRKHHCRTCGQIFDAKCTSLVSGVQFGQSGTLRVCKPCEGIINGHDDSSEFSDDGSVMGSHLRPRHGSTGASDVSPARSLASLRMANKREKELRTKLPTDTVPVMAIPATRRVGEESNRRSAILEIDAEQRLVRPGSSRSLKASFGPRPHSAGHKRHYSRHLPQRTPKPAAEDNAPFQRSHEEEAKKGSRLPAFHSDNIIDPDLADFLSDDESSAEEQLSIMAALSGDGTSRSRGNDRTTLSGLLASSKKSRSRMAEKSISGATLASREADNLSLNSAKMVSSPWSSKRRNLSLVGSLYPRPSPRNHRFSTASPAMTAHLHDTLSSTAVDQLNSPGGGLRMIRSSAMKGIDAPPVELNNASIQHVRKLLRQLLYDSSIPNVSSWEKALVPILLQATDDVNPDVQHGDDIDIRHYVKLKKIPGGRPGDTAYVSGLVFTKNLALKSMPRSIAHPSILILTFPLEYARHQQHFMSLEPVIRQEREFLQNLVHRIAALRPQLLLVQRNVSGLALEFLEQANIATAYNVKPSVLEAVSRCSQTRIISSIDKLAIKPAQAGKCASFYLKTYVYNKRKKTYMYLSGCPKELGCTVVLRGADDNTLAKIKRITEFMVYVVYNLKLETCLMRDEFALIPTYTGAGSISPDKDLARKSAGMANLEPYSSQEYFNHGQNKGQSLGETLDGSGTQGVVPAGILKNTRDIPLYGEMDKVARADETRLPEDLPMPLYYSDMVEKHQDKILSASPFVKFMQPYLLMRAREQERRLVYLKRLRDQDLQEVQNGDDEIEPQDFNLIKPEMIHESVRGTSKKFREILQAVHDAEYDKALHNYRTQKRQWEAYITGSLDLFDPFAHQNIAVLYSVVCTVTTVPCSGPDILALGFYNEHAIDEDFEADCTLGQYVEDLCLGANTVCNSNGCEKKMLEHHRQYVHGSAQLSVTIEHHASKLRGLQDIILMWSTCRICGQDTQVMPMSDSTWKYSFGKYLELSFWCSDLHARAGVCPHDLHRDHLRYFGFKDVALRIQYDPINPLEIIVPRTKITWKVTNDLKLKNEVFGRTEDRLNRFMNSVKARITSIKVDSVTLGKAEACKEEVDTLMKRAEDEHEYLRRKLQEKYMNSRHFELIPLNRAIRALQEKVAEWDSTFAEFDRNFFPSEKDIRRLAALQLKKIFLDREDSTSSTSVTDGPSTEGGTETPPTSEGDIADRVSSTESSMLIPNTRHMSDEKAQDMLSSVVGDFTDTEEHTGQHNSERTAAISNLGAKPGEHYGANLDNECVRHLDLAITSNLPESPGSSPTSHIDDSRTVNANKLNGMERAHNGSRIPAGPLESPESSERLLLNASASSTVQGPNMLRLPEMSSRRPGINAVPPFHRTQSQPAYASRETTLIGGLTTPMAASVASNTVAKKLGEPIPNISSDISKQVDNKISDRMGLGIIKSSGIATHSMIPRSIASRRKESRVSTLAKHFEQLSREFEKERLRDRRQRAAKSRQARAYPMATSKPIVEVYRNVHDAVEEREPSEEGSLQHEVSRSKHRESMASTAENSTQHSADHVSSNGNTAEDSIAEETAAEDTAAEDTAAELTENDEHNQFDNRVESDAEGAGGKSEDEHYRKGQVRKFPDSQELLTSSETSLDLKIDLPKHEKTSLMKMLTNFWAERSASGWQALEYPLTATDHVFADSDIIIREDEPSSLIAFALGSEDYQTKLQNIKAKSRGLKSKHDKNYIEDPMLDTDEQMQIEKSLLQSTGTHLKYQFQEGSAKMLCKIFYAEQFDAVRRKCAVADRIVESLSRCLKWDSKGGKTKSVFLKTLDDRIVLKSLSQIETQAFLRFAPAYFQLMAEALFHDLPSVIAKMLGFYQVVIKNPATGVEFNWFLLVMENLFYDRSPTRIFDLKGSMRNRRIQSTGEQNEVLLDENMVEFIYESPLFTREHSKKLLRASVWNDTLFLSRQNVMDYSLMIAIDDDRKELVVGIIDCIRTYTWDKKLESWMKDRGKNRPTVTSPKEYKNRFREAMGRYVLQAPNCWHQFSTQHIETRPMRFDHRVTSHEEDVELQVADV